MIADTTRDVITMTSNTGKYPPTYGDLFPYVIERGGTSPDGVEMKSSGPWPVTNIDTPAGDEASMAQPDVQCIRQHLTWQYQQGPGQNAARDVLPSVATVSMECGGRQ